jgi:hypothetical protein
MWLRESCRMANGSLRVMLINVGLEIKLWAVPPTLHALRQLAAGVTPDLIDRFLSIPHAHGEPARRHYVSVLTTYVFPCARPRDLRQHTRVATSCITQTRC